MKRYDFKILALAALAMSLSLMTSACSKGGGGGVAAVPTATVPYGYGTGYGYGYGGSPSAGGAALAQVVGDYGAGPSAELQLTLYANGGSAQFGSYQGVVSAAGSFMVAAPYSNCGLMPGQYQVQTAQPGQMSGTEIQNLALIATGPAQVQIQIYGASLTQGTGGIYRLANYGGGILVQGYGGTCQMLFY